MINRNNYEAWFLDFAEGNLSEEKIYILNLFLRENPDLQEEFDEFNVILLDSDDLVFDKKASLKKNINLDKIEGLNDFEILAINKLEGNITEEEENELNSMIHFSDELRIEADIFQKTKLKADTSVVYQDKEKLKRKNVIPLWIKYTGSIAAIGLLLFFVTKIVISDADTGNAFAKKQNHSNSIPVKKSDIHTDINPNSDKIILPKHNPVEIVSSQKQKETDKSYTVSKIQSGKQSIQDLAIAENNNDMLESNSAPKVSISINHIVRNKTELHKYDLPSLAGLNQIEERNTLAMVDKNENINTPLTPKQFIIKSVKEKLDIDDNDYEKVNAVEIVSATLEKTKIGKLDFKKSKNTGRKYLAINIAGFGIERTWDSN